MPESSREILLEARGVHSYYGASHILHGVDFRVHAGETVGLMGRNGMGKTTLIRTMMGLVPARQGEVLVHGQPVTRTATHRIAQADIANAFDVPLHGRRTAIDAAADRSDLAAVIGALQRTGMGGGVGIYVDTDSKDSTRYLVHFSQSGIGLPDESYFRDERHAAVGRFEGDTFDPRTWKPRVPTAAYLAMRADDAFWAAKIVARFSDEAIRSVVATGDFVSKDAESFLAEIVMKRRDKIGRAYLPAVNPTVSPALDRSGTLTFGNAAVEHRVAAPPRRYTAVWYGFDNATGVSTKIGETSGESARLAAPAGLPASPGAFVRVDIAAEHADHPSWSRPVEAHFRLDQAGWSLVGFERLPEGQQSESR